MNVEIGTEAPIFLFWEYLLQIFDIFSLQCTRSKLAYLHHKSRETGESIDAKGLRKLAWHGVLASWAGKEWPCRQAALRIHDIWGGGGDPDPGIHASDSHSWTYKWQAGSLCTYSNKPLPSPKKTTDQDNSEISPTMQNFKQAPWKDKNPNTYLLQKTVQQGRHTQDYHTRVMQKQSWQKFTSTAEKCKQKSITTRLSYSWNFRNISGSDEQCCGSVTIWHESRSADPYLWLTDPDPAIFFSDLQDGN